MLRLTRDAIEQVNLDPLRRYVADPTEFFGPNQHYRLLAYLSAELPIGSTAVDIGTHRGDSALALSYCSKKVDSFDVVDSTNGAHPPNVHYHLADLFDPKTREEWRNTLLDSALILIDIDPHEGTREHEMFQWLSDNDYKGLIVFDDIWYFKPMRDNFWYRIDPLYKIDATALGHWSGTGIVSFNESVQLELEHDTSDWTLVTGYFDLTRKPDANDAIRARPASHYIDQHGSSVLSLNKNLIVYCDPNLEDKIWSMRPKRLHSRTRVVPMSFERFPLTRHRSRIVENRGGVSGCRSDPRNTASYYLFCMARYSMMKSAIDDNQFGSTHFAWINICIERMGFKNLIHLDEALSVQRDRFSTCWIDYVPKELVEDLPRYFCGNECTGRCSMCSGFFTGRADYMRATCDRLEEEFLRCLGAGHGHADEQLYPLVYFKNPELFDWYCGDYTEMITNYAGVREHPERPISNLIRNSLASGDYAVCRRACDILLSSHASGKCTLNPDEHSELLRSKATCVKNMSKNLCLVFDSEPDEPAHRETYDSHRSFWNKHLDNSPVEGFFIRSDPNLDVDHKIENRTLTVKGDAGHDGTIHRLCIALEMLLKDHPYVIITGLSALHDLRMLQDRPIENGVYAGHVVQEEGPYVSGAGALMSNDVARILIDSRNLACSRWADVAIGEILRAKGVAPKHEPMFIFDYAQGIGQIRGGTLRYRIKDEHGDRVLEREVMRAVFEQMHPVSLELPRQLRLTLVTAFFRLRDRPIDEDEQFRQFDRLASSGLSIMLFLDEQLAHRAPKQPNVQVILMPLNGLPSFLRLDARELPENRTPGKDTRDFMLLQNSKIDLLNEARTRDSSSTHFAWIDFGIMKIVRDEAVFKNRLRDLVPPPSCVLAPGCWQRERSDQANAQGVNWRFCGGFLLADRASIPDLAAAHRAAFKRQERLTWEVNVWADMERAGQKFDWYQADHDDSMVPWTPLEIHSGTRVCLNMIVKNEAHIIGRCLTAALPFIDTWCILDTGSTDDTIVRIERFFAEHGVPGKVVRGTFKNYAQARNDALTSARAMPGWDYALLIDADMVITGTLDKSVLTASAYQIVQRASDIDYPNTRLVRREASALYLSVTHEYLSVEGVENLDTLAIDDRADGGDRPEKGERDIRLLNEGLVEEPNNGRYMFYLAQTYRGMGRQQEALQWYKRRIEVGGWDEEIWASYYGMAHSYKELGETANFIKACFEAYNYRPSRGESLRLLARYYREKAQSESAFVVANVLSEIEYPKNSLFVERDVYDYAADQELSISGYWSKIPSRRETGYRACMDLTVHPNHGVRNEARANATHYAKSAHEIFGAEVREIDWKPNDGWAPMNPSVCTRNNGRRHVLVRTVNYKVTREGQYPTIDNSGIIKTRNHVLEMDQDWRPIGSTQITDLVDIPRTKFPVEGYEDCRLWGGGRGGYRISATVRDFEGNEDGRCEIAIVHLDEQWRVTRARAVRNYEHDKTQKNWMPIVGEPGKFLYLCAPTIAIDASGDTTVEIARHYPSLHLGELRGGSQLIASGDGWLCLVHEVVWRPERVYLHRFVRFDKTFRVIAISDPFYFAQVGIEFCAGLARDGDRLVASFGVNDESAHLAFFRPDAVDHSLNLLGSR